MLAAAIPAAQAAVQGVRGRGGAPRGGRRRISSQSTYTESHALGPFSSHCFAIRPGSFNLRLAPFSRNIVHSAFSYVLIDCSFCPSDDRRPDQWNACARGCNFCDRKLLRPRLETGVPRVETVASQGRNIEQRASVHGEKFHQSSSLETMVPEECRTITMRGFLRRRETRLLLPTRAGCLKGSVWRLERWRTRFLRTRKRQSQQPGVLP